MVHIRFRELPTVILLQQLHQTKNIHIVDDGSNATDSNMVKNNSSIRVQKSKKQIRSEASQELFYPLNTTTYYFDHCFENIEKMSRTFETNPSRIQWLMTKIHLQTQGKSNPIRAQ